MTITTTFAALRMAVGAGTWLTPAGSMRLFGLGRMPAGSAASVALVGRLFAARELALGLAVHQPDPGLRRAALQAGVVIDSVDAIASLISVRSGAPRAVLVGGALGAATFAALGVVALRENGA